MKYIIDIPKTVGVSEAVGSVHYTYFDGIQCKTIVIKSDEIEELNSDYINEHFGDLQDDAYNKGYARCQDDYSGALKHAKDTAYKKGLHDGESKCGYCNEYQRGLDDAWEAARKIIHMPEGKLLNIFTECYSAVCTALQVLLKYDASEAIEKLKAYEEKQKADDKIKRGDIVNVKGSCNDDLLGVVTKVWEDNCYILWGDGSGGAWCKDSVVKTGKHIDVDKFFEEIAT